MNAMTSKTAKYALLLGAVVALPLTFQAQNKAACSAGGPAFAVKTTSAEAKPECSAKAVVFTSAEKPACNLQTTSVQADAAGCAKTVALTSTGKAECAWQATSAQSGAACGTKQTTFTSAEKPECAVKTVSTNGDAACCAKQVAYTSAEKVECSSQAVSAEADAACCAKQVAYTSADKAECSSQAVSAKADAACCAKQRTLTSAGKSEGALRTVGTQGEAACGARAKKVALTSAEKPSCEGATCETAKVAFTSTEKATECSASQTVAATQAGFIKVSYQVDGLACSACEKKLTKVLGQIDGVSAPEACAKSKVAKVSYDPKKVKDKQLVTAIEKAGYQVKSETIEVKVDGMSCSACSTKVGKALTSVEGVKEQKVCHVAKQAVVTFDPKQVSRDKVIAAIDSTGFKTVQ